MINSTLYTIGTALARAQDNGLAVDLLVTGQWLRGQVSAVDGHGVMLVGENDELSIIRIQEVAAVRVLRGEDFVKAPQVETREAHEFHDGARPMPAASRR